MAVVAPSGPVDVDRVRQGAAILESWGLSVQFSPSALSSSGQFGYLSADDATRAEDFTRAWTDPATALVWAARGGYGSQRMLDLIDFDALRRVGPKHLVGFSDITALHARVGRELGQITIHGPVVSAHEQLKDLPTASQLRTLIMSQPKPGLTLCSGKTRRAGTATGRLVGGNLSLLSSDAGVEPAPSRPSVAIFEEIDESDYGVDRMLTQLERSHWFDQITGVVTGDFSRSNDAGRIERVLADRLDRLGVPTISDVEVGHAPRNLALPLGAEVRLEADDRSGSGKLLLV